MCQGQEVNKQHHQCFSFIYKVKCYNKAVYIAFFECVCSVNSQVHFVILEHCMCCRLFLFYMSLNDYFSFCISDRYAVNVLQAICLRRVSRLFCVFFVIPSVDCIATCRFNLEPTYTFHRTEQRYNGLTSVLNSSADYIQGCT